MSGEALSGLSMLRLSNLADYGVVVMAAAAGMAEDNGMVSAARVSEETGLPYPTVSKLMGRLARAGLLASFRGADGGFAVGRGADEITLAEIVEAIDGPIALTSCSIGEGECNYAEHCSLRPHWSLVSQAVRDVLDGVTLAAVLPAPTPDLHREIV